VSYNEGRHFTWCAAENGDVTVVKRALVWIAYDRTQIVIARDRSCWAKPEESSLRLELGAGAIDRSSFAGD
jgi:hypothetical protein